MFAVVKTLISNDDRDKFIQSLHNFIPYLTRVLGLHISFYFVNITKNIEKLPNRSIYLGYFKAKKFCMIFGNIGGDPPPIALIQIFCFAHLLQIVQMCLNTQMHLQMTESEKS